MCSTTLGRLRDERVRLQIFAKPGVGALVIRSGGDQGPGDPGGGRRKGKGGGKNGSLSQACKPPGAV